MAVTTLRRQLTNGQIISNQLSKWIKSGSLEEIVVRHSPTGDNMSEDWNKLLIPGLDLFLATFNQDRFTQ